MGVLVCSDNFTRANSNVVDGVRWGAVSSLNSPTIVSNQAGVSASDKSAGNGAGAYLVGLKAPSYRVRATVLMKLVNSGAIYADFWLFLKDAGGFVGSANSVYQSTPRITIAGYSFDASFFEVDTYLGNFKWGGTVAYGTIGRYWNKYAYNATATVNIEAEVIDDFYRVWINGNQLAQERPHRSTNGGSFASTQFTQLPGVSFYMDEDNNASSFCKLTKLEVEVINRKRIFPVPVEYSRANLEPTSIVSESHLTGAYTDIDEGVYAPDNSWLTKV